MPKEEENTKNFSKMRSIRLYRNKKGKAVEDSKKGKKEKTGLGRLKREKQ